MHRCMIATPTDLAYDSAPPWLTDSLSRKTCLLRRRLVRSIGSEPSPCRLESGIGMPLIAPLRLSHRQLLGCDDLFNGSGPNQSGLLI